MPGGRNRIFDHIDQTLEARQAPMHRLGELERLD